LKRDETVSKAIILRKKSEDLLIFTTENKSTDCHPEASSGQAFVPHRNDSKNLLLRQPHLLKSNESYLI